MRPSSWLRLLLIPVLGVGAAVAPTALAAPTSPTAPSCSWYGETDQRDVNIGAPDLDAYYWATALPVTSAGTVAVDGQYPRARYFSFHVYDTQGQPLDSVYDQRINPARHSDNPYRRHPRPGHAHRYHLTVRFTARPRHPAPNTLYAPAGSLDGGVALLVYRVYVPTNPRSPQGGVAFPRLTVHLPGGGTIAEAPCSTTPPPFGSALWSTAAATNYPAAAPEPAVSGAGRRPVWQRQFGSALGNQQNAYLATTIARRYGQILVIHTRAPSFPDNRAGVAPYRPAQLRYWSYCVYDTQGQAGYGCAADYAARIRHGAVTYVVSDPADRPRNADPRHAVTWLPWGGTQNGAQIVYRNMLPAPGYGHAAERITRPTQSAARLMGRYYPTAVYCSTRTFQRGGWRACFAAARR